ncbi:sodium:proton antiporter [Flavobacterium salilacus subsp. salilacus]|uniref:sodium:proton antiporter n=1 Tax=Flavobacterium TaxID=237 RepID=UPI001074F59C|nr:MULTISPECIES: sodium:proton antiporter [Flavobacterium]KAF2518682.1 sodium:proton antiporter [Flavobacterium salilacus subsp. salilacus]MBE1613645.1 sodium:proton antiporter [Flavobacterium sp. SaA2.13]
MTAGIILVLCLLVLLAYIFDLTSSKTKIPSVLLLLALGFLVRQLCNFFGITLVNLESVLPILGSVGLILIVLEGALELELTKDKIPVIKRSVIIGFVPLIILALILAFAFNYITGIDFKICLINAIPLAIISSSVAIPSVRSFMKSDREFVIYESSISDIIGVILFNFVTMHESFGFMAFGSFFVQLLIIIVISFIATGMLSFMLSRLEHQIKFVPIIFLVILIYEISKEFHLPSLVFILVFGLFLNNLNEIRHISWIQKLKPKVLRREVHKFREITIEATFLVRALFFLLFGYLIELKEVLNADVVLYSAAITAGIYFIRIIALKLARTRLIPLLFIAPRGLITILLFLSIIPENRLPFMNRSLIIQVIIFTSLIMMMGTISSKKEPKESEAEETDSGEIIPAGDAVIKEN